MPNIESHGEAEVDTDVVCLVLKAYPIVHVIMACRNHCYDAEWRAATAV